MMIFIYTHRSVGRIERKRTMEVFARYRLMELTFSSVETIKKYIGRINSNRPDYDTRLVLRFRRVKLCG